jgi:hypothetical protein
MKYRVIDCEFNRANYADLIGKTFVDPPSYCAVELIDDGENDPIQQDEAKAMYTKGYRFRITLGGVNPPGALYVKSALDVGPLMRTMYSNNTISKVERLNESGIEYTA